MEAWRQMQGSTKTLLLFILLLPSILHGKGEPSVFNSGVEINGLRKLGTDTALLRLNNNSATPTYTLEVRASGTLEAYWGRFGNLKIGEFTTASRTALSPGQGEIVFDTDLLTFQGYDGTSWVDLADSSGGGSASGVLSINGASGTVFLASGTGIDIQQVFLNGSTTFTISTAGGGGGSGDATSIQGMAVNNASATSGQALISDGFEWVPNSVLTDPTTMDGDIIYRQTGSLVSLPIGAESQVLTVNNLGFPEWQNSTASGGTSVSSSTKTINFRAISPSTETGKAGGTDPIRGTVFLDPDTEQGVRFGAEIIDDRWDETSSMSLKLYLGTPASSEVATAVFQLKIQTIGDGTDFFSDSNWNIVGTFTIPLTASTTIQTFASSGFIIPVASLSRDLFIGISLNRIGGDPQDTHGADVHITGLRGLINE